MSSSLMLSAWGRKFAKNYMTPPKAQPGPKIGRWNIVKGDLVEVIQGPQTGSRGKILTVLRDANSVIIDGVNMVSISLQIKNIKHTIIKLYSFLI